MATFEGCKGSYLQTDYKQLKNQYIMKTEYEQQAEKFLSDTNSALSIEFLKNDYHFDGDKDKRDIYTCTLKRGSRKYKFNFGQSIMNSSYYEDTQKKGCTYTVNGNSRTGNYKILDVAKYSSWLKLKKGTAPTAYDILACLTKYNPCTFENFCSEYGYDTDSRRAKKTYKAVHKEYNALAAMYSDSEMELMAEIQ